VIEIISHCISPRYAALLVYHLSSLVLRESTPVTMTVVYSKEDPATVTVLDYFSQHAHHWIKWNFVDAQLKSIHQRPIWRNIAARQSKADIIWFADCDYVFGSNCLDTLASLQLDDDAVYWPAMTLYCKDLKSWRKIVRITRDRDEITPDILDIDPEDFVETPLRRAIGGVQIVSGNTARKVGYLQDYPQWQQPLDKWKRDDGSAFWRNQFETLKKLSIPNVYRI